MYINAIIAIFPNLDRWLLMCTAWLENVVNPLLYMSAAFRSRTSIGRADG
jgi:hypothetical protein